MGVDPKVKEFLILNGAVLILVLFYLLRRRPRSRMKLSLKRGWGGGQGQGGPHASSAEGSAMATLNGDSGRKALTGEYTKTITGNSEGKGGSSKRSTDPANAGEKEFAPRRSLNVIFNYNGHSWDAYEVLGIPAGSPIDKVNEAYQSCLSLVDQESRVFVDTAYQSILAHLRS